MPPFAMLTAVLWHPARGGFVNVDKILCGIRLDNFGR